MKTNQRRTMKNNDDRISRAVDQAALERAICDNLTPEGVAAIVAMLQTAGSYSNGTPVNEAAFNQVVWFRDTLLDMIGAEKFNEVVEEIGL